MSNKLSRKWEREFKDSHSYTTSKDLDSDEYRRGHVWKRDKWIVFPDGYVAVEIFAYDMGSHNGPECMNCGYSFCYHCKKGPEYGCSRPETMDGEDGQDDALERD